MPAPLRSVLSSVLLATLLLGAGLALVLPRTEGGGPGGAIRGDSLAYLAMTRGEWQAAPPPFRFRPALPALAGLLPLPAPAALRAVSLLCLWACYVLCLEVGRRAGLSRTDAAAGLFAVATTGAHLYLLHNPYTTDAGGLLALWTGLDALLGGAFAACALALALGTWVRESTLFLAPAWASWRQPGRTAALLLLCALAWALPRGWLAGGLAEVPPAGSVRDVVPFSRFLGDAVATWHVLWLWMGVGLWRLPASVRPRALAAGACLLGGALLASQFATDTGRMFLALAPVAALGAGRFLAEVRARSPWLALALLAVLLLSLPLWTPLRPFGGPLSAPAARAGRGAFWALAVPLTLWAWHRVRAGRPAPSR